MTTSEMRTMTRRRTLRGSAAGIGLALMGGVALPAYALEGSLTVWGALVFSDEANATFAEEVETWGEDNSVDVEFVNINQNETVQKLSAAVESGATPDVMALSIDKVELLAQQDLFLPLDDLFAKLDEAHGGFFDAVAEATDTTDSVGTRVGIPYGIGGQMLLMRRDLMEEAGITEPPKTWAEVVDQSEQVSEFPVKGFGFALSNVGDGNTLIQVMQSYGGRIADDAGENATIESEETRAFLEFIKDAWDRDVFPAGAATWDGAGDNQAYLSGQTAFVANTGSIGVAAKSQDPELFEATALTALPSGPVMQVSQINPVLYTVAADTENPEAAEALVEHLSNPEFLNRYYEAATYGPVYKPQADAQVFQGDDPILAGLLELSQTGVAPAYPDKFNPAYADVFNNYIIPKMVQRVVIDEWSIDDAMAEAQEQAQLIYDKY